MGKDPNTSNPHSDYGLLFPLATATLGCVCKITPRYRKYGVHTDTSNKGGKAEERTGSSSPRTTQHSQYRIAPSRRSPLVDEQHFHRVRKVRTYRLGSSCAHVPRRISKSTVPVLIQSCTYVSLKECNEHSCSSTIVVNGSLGQ